MIVAIKDNDTVWLAYAYIDAVTLSRTDVMHEDNVPLFALPNVEGAIAGFGSNDITADIASFHFVEAWDDVSKEGAEAMLKPLGEKLEQYGIKRKDGWDNALIVAKQGASSFVCVTPTDEVVEKDEYFCFGTGLEKKLTLGRLFKTENLPPLARIEDLFNTLSRTMNENYFPVAVMNTADRELIYLEGGNR